MSLEFRDHASLGLASREECVTALAVKERNIGGQIYLVFIGLAVAAMGGIFVAWLWKGYTSAKETRTWTQVSGVILESAVQERVLGPSIPMEFAFKLTYEYSFERKSYLGERLRVRENPWSKERKKAEVLAGRFHIGQEVTAFVNPENPAEAILEHETKAPGYSIWFPCLFVIGGLGIVLRALWQMSKKEP